MMVLLTEKEYDLLIKAVGSAIGYYEDYNYCELLLAEMEALKDKLEALKINIGR